MEIHFSMTPRLAVVGGVCLLALMGVSFVLGMRVERVIAGPASAHPMQLPTLPSALQPPQVSPAAAPPPSLPAAAPAASIVPSQAPAPTMPAGPQPAAGR